MVCLGLFCFALNAAEVSVFGKYERTEVEDTTDYPYSAIGLLIRGCTGTLISDRVLVTAAHCVYDTLLQDLKFRKKFSPGQYGQTKPYGEYNFKKVYVPLEYKKKMQKEYDIAFVLLDSKVVADAGFVPARPAALKSSSTLMLAGYPGDQPFGSLWETECPLESATSHVLSYLCDTYDGMSGSPILVYGSSYMPSLVGVHVRGKHERNEGTYLTSKVLEEAQEYLGVRF